jgi:hypothetical protein
MSVNGNQVVEDGDFEELAPPSVALVPLARSPQRLRKFSLPRPDPSFVAQLLATAEQLPQTRELRRAAPADAMNAYRAGQRNAVDGTGRQTRQII